MNLTQDELKIIRTGKCPDCEGQLLAGPKGGAAINVMCDHCRHKFNVVFFGAIGIGERLKSPAEAAQ